MENKEKIILEAMEKAGKPLKSAEIAALSGLDPKEVSKIIATMKKGGKIATPKACYYEPSK